MLILVYVVPPAAACPVCDSDDGARVRTALVDDDLPMNLLAVTAPFILVSGVVAIVHFGIPSRRRPR